MLRSGTPSAMLGVAALALAAGGVGGRRVNWFNSGGDWTIGTDGLDFQGWLQHYGPRSAAPAITGTFPCCGCWAVKDSNASTDPAARSLPLGAFYSTGRCASTTKNPSAHTLARDAGLTIEPTGAFSDQYLLGEMWMLPGALDSAVSMLQHEGWTGLGIDNENAPPKMPPHLPEMFRRLLGNLSEIMVPANKTVVVDVCSTWGGDIGGPEYLSGYAASAPNNVRFMDMAEYDAKGHVAGGVKSQLATLTKMLPLQTIAPAVGLTEMPGHENASCGGWPQCTNRSNPACGCLNYGWNQSSFAAFVRQVEALGIEEIDVWRQDMTPPPGTTASVPPWLITELSGFLKRGYTERARKAHSVGSTESLAQAQVRNAWLSVMNPGYGGRASPRKKGGTNTRLGSKIETKSVHPD